MNYSAKISATEYRKSTFESIFAILYRKARLEFIKEYKRKNIDWQKKPTKIFHSVPSWRKTNSSPPTTAFNIYANNVFGSITQAEPIIKADVINNQQTTFLKMV